MLVRGGQVALEDSDLLFDNIVSLAFHYTQVWCVLSICHPRAILILINSTFLSPSRDVEITSDNGIISSDELPERLTLPDVLATASSLQNLVSLSLLGKSNPTFPSPYKICRLMMSGFWSYPMARSGRMSVFLCETDRARGEEAQEEADKGRLTRDVGRGSMLQPSSLLLRSKM